MKEQTKVLMFGWEFPPFNTGGLGTACYGLTKSLSEKGVSIKLVLPRPLPIQVDFLKCVSTDFEVNIVNSILQPYMANKEYSEVLSSQENPLFYGGSLIEEVLRYATKARGIAEKEEFDVIHAHDWLTFLAGIEAKKISNKPLIAHVHATEFDRTGGNGINQYVYDKEKYGMEHADQIIAVSNFTKQKIIQHYGINPNKIKVVHNGVEWENHSDERHPSLLK